MAKDDEGQGAEDTGTYKITEAEINRIVADIGTLLETLAENPSAQTLRAFAGDKGTPGFDRIYAGSGRGAVAANALSDKYAKFAAGMTAQLKDMDTNLRQLITDLKLAHQYMRQGEDAAALTAQEMMADLQDVIAAFGGSAPAAPPATTTT